MSETSKRILAGSLIGIIVILLLQFLYVFYALPALLFIAVVGYLGLEEFYNFVDKGIAGKPIRFLGRIFGILILVSYYLEFLYASRDILDFPFILEGILEEYYRLRNPVIPVLILFLLSSMTYSMLFRPLDGQAYNVMSTVTGVLYVFLPLATVLPMLSLQEGKFVFVFTALGTIMTDVGGYFGGRWFGKHNAGLKVSPRKTWEGYITGILFANAFNLAFLYFWLKFQNKNIPETSVTIPSYMEASLVTLALSLIGIFGDLVESALKRDARVKDSSQIIPGHGGVLDLMDAMLFTFPAGYFYFYIKTQILL